MNDIMDRYFTQVQSYVEQHHWLVTESTEPGCRRMNVQNGKMRCVVKVYSTGTILLQGGESPLKTALLSLKESIEQGTVISEDILPLDIEYIPDKIRPFADPIVVQFTEEAILTLKANAYLACAYLLGAASEFAILTLIETYVRAIPEETTRNNLAHRLEKRAITEQFTQFKASWKSSQNKPANFHEMHDFMMKIENTFQFTRMCRNEAGHPYRPPHLDRGMLIGNLAYFATYLEEIYSLISYYQNHSAQV